MKANVFILDFDDSFTYNLASELLNLGIEANVIPKTKIKNALETLIETTSKKVIIYGPGPGHPDEYKEFFPLMKKGLENPHLFHYGVCLGHQILWKLKGYEIIKAKVPMHGQDLEFCIPNWPEFAQNIWGKKVSVQHYNSLVVDGVGNQFLRQNEEVVAGRFDRGVSFQFHPESVGTSSPNLFLSVIKENL